MSDTPLMMRGPETPLNLLLSPKARTGPDFPALIPILQNLRQPLDPEFRGYNPHFRGGRQDPRLWP